MQPTTEKTSGTVLVMIDNIFSYFRFIGDFIYLQKAPRILGVNLYNGQIIWRNDTPIVFNTFGSSFSYPLDEYFLGFDMDVKYLEGGDKEKAFKSMNCQENVSIELGNNFKITSIKSYKEIPEWHGKDFINESTKVREGNFIFKIERPTWLKYYVLFLLSLCLIPVYFVCLRKIKDFSNLDFLGSIISVLGIRSIILGQSIDIYAIDVYFGVLLCIVFTVPIIKKILNKI
ncbi:MAG: hypothetical protein HY096_06075 [Nitrospinae bacterium]|nr:hypothetical protein [Nitrospinota bacterium]